MNFSRFAVNTCVPLDDLFCGIVLRSIKDLGKRREKARKRKPSSSSSPSPGKPVGNVHYWVHSRVRSGSKWHLLLTPPPSAQLIHSSPRSRRETPTQHSLGRTQTTTFFTLFFNEQFHLFRPFPMGSLKFPSLAERKSLCPRFELLLISPCLVTCFPFVTRTQYLISTICEIFYLYFCLQHKIIFRHRKIISRDFFRKPSLIK